MQAQAFYRYGNCTLAVIEHDKSFYFREMKVAKYSTEMLLTGLKLEKFMNITDRHIQ